MVTPINTHETKKGRKKNLPTTSGFTSTFTKKVLFLHLKSYLKA